MGGTMSTRTTKSGTGSRPPGRPRIEIDLAAVADTAATLFSEGGFEAVSVEAVAERLAVSRATLYRTVPTKNHLLEILFRRCTKQAQQAVMQLLEKQLEPADELAEMIRLHVSTAIEIRRYLVVFFSGAGLPTESQERWREFTQEYEQLWLRVVSRAIAAGILPEADPLLIARLLFGMLIWVSRWYRGDESYTSEEISQAILQLVTTRKGI